MAVNHVTVKVLARSDINNRDNFSFLYLNFSYSLWEIQKNYRQSNHDTVIWSAKCNYFLMLSLYYKLQLSIEPVKSD